MLLYMTDETSGAGFNRPRMKQQCFMCATSKMGHAKNPLRDDTVTAGQSILLTSTVQVIHGSIPFQSLSSICPKYISNALSWQPSGLG